MITIPGKPVITCDGLTRRDWLRVGSLGTLGMTGLGLPALFHRPGLSAAETGARGPKFGHAKSCIVLFMFGAPAHQDTWDLKPNAPAEVRGEFQPIDSNVAGTQVSEHIPKLAQLADKYAIVRSVTHPDNTHTVAMHTMLTGVRHKRPATNPQNAPDDFPCFGSVVNFMSQQGANSRSAGLPAAISLNAPANQVSANNHIFPGFFAGFLGHGYDPLFVSDHPHEQNFKPFPAVASMPRLERQRALLAEFDRQRESIDDTAVVRELDGQYRRAFDLLTSSATRRAFELDREQESLRNEYGQTPFGQGCLLARRLVEAGVSLVTVNWERDDAYWDTHKNNFIDHKNKLLPNMDRGFSALLNDLDRRGLLDETLVVWLAEFGRTPKINGNAGRDHWADCNSVVLAGGGVRGGLVYGASDRIAAYPERDPVRPEDLSATIYHLLGVDREHLLRDPEGRPLPISTGEPLWNLFA